MENITITRQAQPKQLLPIERIEFLSMYGSSCSIEKSSKKDYECNFSKPNIIIDKSTMQELVICLQSMLDDK